ncbi:MAG: Ig-like domain-containing protein [Ferruginibacter sp.]
MKKKNLPKILLLLLIAGLTVQSTFAQTSPTAQSVPYSQDFSGLAANSTVYPAGWQGWTISTSPSSSFNTNTPTADRTLTASSTAAVNSGNVHNYDGKIGFLNSGSLDLGLVLAVNTTGESNIAVVYDIMTIRNPYDGTSNTRVNEVTLQYRVGTTGSFINLAGIEYQNNTTTQTTAITTPQNSVNKTITLPVDCEGQPVVQLRWASKQISGAGSRPSFAIDNIAVGTAGPDVTPPTVSSLSPADNATNVLLAAPLIITFSEGVSKNTGDIVIKNLSDNSIVQTIDVTGTDVAISGSTATITAAAFAASTGYYVEVDNGAFQDGAGNAFAGISGSTTWNFTTGTGTAGGVIGMLYDFSTCTSSITDGFTQYSVTGPQIWACTTFGHDPSDPTGKASLANGVQINGFSGTNIENEDWFISPAFDLTSTTFPLLSFWTRTTFNGEPLQLKVSTNYSGAGNPSSSTWTDVDSKFPLQTSDTWTLSQNINLSAYKSANTYFAFVYNSSNDDGARWTVDDITITNSATAPPASLNTNTKDISFGFVANGSSSAKTFKFTGNDITGPVTINTSGNYLISKTNGSFTSSISYTQAEANNITETVYVQFTPSAPSQTYNSSVTISTAGTTDVVVNVTGNSIDAANTLEVVNWNLEWFGSTLENPADDNQQEANVKLITQNIGADLFAFAEVVSEPRLQNVVANLNAVYGAGTYAYKLCDYGSHTNPNEVGHGNLSDAQKEAFVYKTANFSNITTQALATNGPNTAADLTNPAYNYFSSGRYPYMMTADVTLGGITKQIRFVLLHAKANTSPTATSYARRKNGSDTLHQILNLNYPNDNIMVLGDFNDDLDQSITAGFTATSYSAFTSDNTNFFSPTLALSLAGKKSTVSYNDVIDHVIVSNELQPFYLGASASILTDVSSLVSNYGSTTTDHYPVFTRYAFDAAILPVNLIKFNAVKQNNTVALSWTTAQEANSKNFVIERSTDGITWTVLSMVNAAGNSTHESIYTATDFAPQSGVNSYRLKQVDQDSKYVYSVVRSVLFNKSYDVKMTPNPATIFVNVSIVKDNHELTQIFITNAIGRTIEKYSTTDQTKLINTSNYAKGVYFIKTITGSTINTQKIIVQ